VLRSVEIVALSGDEQAWLGDLNNQRAFNAVPASFANLAIDEYADHPHGVYVARCGHRLRIAINPHDDPPGRICISCSRWRNR